MNNELQTKVTDADLKKHLLCLIRDLSLEDDEIAIEISGELFLTEQLIETILNLHSISNPKRKAIAMKMRISLVKRVEFWRKQKALYEQAKRDKSPS